jgi:hypothetical protein
VGDMKIDLKAKKTEADWQKTLDIFWTKATPQWFQWLEWILILGAIAFLTEKTQNITLDIVSGISYIALFFYLQSFFFSLEFHGFPLLRSERAKRLVSLIVSGLLSLTLWLLLTNLVSEIQGKV